MTESPDIPERAEEGVTPSAGFKRRRRARSLAIALSLAALVVLFYLVTIAKIGSNLAQRAL